jgi:signal transduction histidine kinase
LKFSARHTVLHGKTPKMQVQQILDKKGDRIITMSCHLPVLTVSKVMAKERIGTVMMVDDAGALAGILSERDIIRLVSQDSGASIDQPASALMTTSLVTCTPETDLEDVLSLMSEHTIRHLPVMRDGELAGLISVRDVLDAQRDMFVADLQRQTQAAEAMKLAKEKAEIANRTKTEFLANMSHELKTPLNAIVGFSESLVTDTFGPIGSPKVKEYIEEIHSSGLHLLGIINDILDLSRIETGERLPAESDVDLRQTIENCLRLMSKRAVTAKIALTTDISPGLFGIRADARMVKQMLMNLLSNAVKFTPAGGSVTLKASLGDDRGLEIAISDTGIGIAEDQFETMLEPFSQADGSLTRQEEGLGLGLALVASMMLLHDGRLEIASELGRGTTATLHFDSSRVLSDNAPAQTASGRLSA